MEVRMSRHINIMLALYLNGCGADVAETIAKDDEVPSTTSAGSCTVNKKDGKAKISCPDGSEAVVEDGEPGPEGSNGTDGSSGVNGSDGATGTAGSSGANGSTGATGTDGTNGTNGTNGIDASSVVVYDSAGYSWGSKIETSGGLAIKMTNGYTMGVEFNSPYAMENTSSRVYFTTADCTGSVYIAANAAQAQDISYVRSRTKWFGTTGSIKTTLNYNSYEDSSGSCTASTSSQAIYYESIEVSMSGYSAKISYATGNPRITDGPFYYD